LEKACGRDLEAMWLMRRLAPDYRTIAAFRHDNPEAIVSACAAFVQFCRDQGLVGGRMVALDGTKMRAVASPKNIAGAERLARDIAHTEKEIAYYLDRLDIIDETVAHGFDDQPLHRESFKAAIASLERRKDRLANDSKSSNAATRRCWCSASPRRNRWAMPERLRCPPTTSRASSMSRAG
jgi:transposase